MVIRRHLHSPWFCFWVTRMELGNSIIDWYWLFPCAEEQKSKQQWHIMIPSIQQSSLVPLPFFLHLLDNQLPTEYTMNPCPWESVKTPGIRMTNLPRSFALRLWLERSFGVSWQQHAGHIWTHGERNHKSHAFEISQEKPCKTTLQTNQVKRQRVHCKQPANLTWFCDLDRIYLPNSHDTDWKTMKNYLAMLGRHFEHAISFGTRLSQHGVAKSKPFKRKMSFNFMDEPAQIETPSCLLSDKIH